MRGDPDLSFGERLLSVLNATLDRNDLAYSEAPCRLPGGYSADLFAFRLANAPDGLDGPLVVRLMKDDCAAARETSIQQAVAELGFPAPRVRLSGISAGALAQPFAVMDRLQGIHPVTVSGPLSLWRAFQRIPHVLADTMAALHALEARGALDQLLAAGFSASELGADAVLGEIERRLLPTEGRSGLNWLRQHRPAPPMRVVVCHGDLHAFNLLALEGRITAVLDWELATVSAKEFDVARTIVLLRFVPGPMSAAVRLLVQAMGRRAAREFEDAYTRKLGIDVAALRWHEALHCLRLIALVASDRSGAERSPVAALWQPLVPGLARCFERVSGVELGLRRIPAR